MLKRLLGLGIQIAQRARIINFVKADEVQMRGRTVLREPLVIDEADLEDLDPIEVLEYHGLIRVRVPEPEPEPEPEPVMVTGEVGEGEEHDKEKDEEFQRWLRGEDTEGQEGEQSKDPQVEGSPQ